MIATWMGYWIALSVLIGVAAVGAERARRVSRGSLRWVWAVALVACVVAPFAAGGARWAWRHRPRSAPAAAVSSAPLRVTSAVNPANRVTARHRRDPLALLDPWLLAGWMLASATTAALLLIATRRMHGARATWTAAEIHGQPLLVAPDVGPAVAGFLRPRIVLPEWALRAPDSRLALMILHEREHLRARDPWLLLGAAAGVVLMPWNAVLWWLVRRLRLAIEIDCDARVLRERPDVAAYGALLIEVGRRMSSRRVVPLAALSDPPTLLETRIQMMTARPIRNSLIAALALGALSAVPATAATIVPRPALPQPALHAPWVSRAAIGDSTMLQAVRAMKSSLRTLTTAEEQYFADHEEYASEVARITKYHPDAGVHVRVTWSSGRAWVGLATHDDYPGATCVTYVGWIPTSAWPATTIDHETGEEGTPVCDGDGMNAHLRWSDYARRTIEFQLERIAASQEKAHVASGSYPGDPSKLWANRFDPALHFTYLWATNSSWAVKVMYDRKPGKSCVVWGGERPATQPATDAGHRTADTGKPVCDDL